MVTKKIKIGGMLFLYMVSVFMSFYIEDFARFNPFVLLVFSIAAFICYPHVGSRNLALFATCIAVVTLADVLLGVRFMYTGISVANIFFIIYSLANVKEIELKDKQKRQVLLFCSVLLLLFLIGMPFESLYSTQEDNNLGNEYGQMRYQGLFHAANQSSSVVILLLVLLWELCKDLYRNRKTLLKIILFLILVYFFVYYLQSKTRTLLFALPYFGYQIFKLSNVKYLIGFGIIIGAFLIYRMEDFEFDTSTVRLGEDSSSVTRSYLYLSELEKTMEVNPLLPKGSHTMTDFVVKLMADDDYSPHNDFLRYLHDWGFVFILLLIAIFKYLKHNLETLFIILLFAGSALHNMLFSPFILFPLMLVLIVNYKYEGKRIQGQGPLAHSQKI